MSEKWYILQIKANSHHLAVKNLNQQGFETFLPTYNKTARKGSQFINATQPLFSGYMFVRFDKEKSKWHKVNNTYGVSRLVTFNSAIKSVPNIIINSLIERCDSSGKLLPMKQLKTGDFHYNYYKVALMNRKTKS